jgi:plasmid stabilization system protein ParE
VNPVIRPAARDDIIRQFRWYLVEQDAPDAALRFVDAVEESVQQLLLMPDMGAPREIGNPALKGLPRVAGEGVRRIPNLLCGSRRSGEGHSRSAREARR